LRRILHESGVPAIYVTHDQEEAFAIADRVLLLHEGRIIRDGSPAQVWREPGSAWVARFLGLGNVIEGRSLGGGRVETAFGTLESDGARQAAAGASVALLIRPVVALAGDGVNRLGGRVADVLFQNEHFRVTLEGGLFFHLPEAPRVGEDIRIHVPPSAVEFLA
jgi:ABC-type Fe3+/spermidine/putrescine transport system ATPase subunit